MQNYTDFERLEIKAVLYNRLCHSHWLPLQGIQAKSEGGGDTVKNSLNFFLSRKC